MNLSGTRVLITGGLGFVGSNLARRLVGDGAEVTVVDNLAPAGGGNPQNVADFRDRLSVRLGDAADPALMSELVRGQRFVFHLAAQTGHSESMRDPLADLHGNVVATIVTLDACRRANPDARVVFASTRQLYGRPDYLPVDEQHPVRPVDVNAINKQAAEWYHRLFDHVHGLHCTILRLTNTYGPGMRVKDARQMFLGVWIRAALEGGVIKVFGDGRQRRDLNFVDDVVDALLLAATRDTAVGKTYNLGSDEVVMLNDLASMVVGTAGSGRIEYAPFPDDRKSIDVGDSYCSFALAERELGWRPRTTLADGLTRTLDFYRAHGPRYWSVVE